MNKTSSLTMATTGRLGTCLHAFGPLLAGWIMSACSWRWRQYQHQCTRPMPVTTTNMRTDLHPLLYSADQLLNVEYRAYQRSNEWIWVYGITISVMRYLRCLCEHVVPVWVRRCMRMRVIPISLTGIPVFYLQTCWSETFRQLTIRTVIPIGHPTILVWY